MNIRQRINFMFFLSKLISIEKHIHLKLVPDLPYERFPINRFGADFFVGLVFILINSTWVSVVFYFLLKKPENVLGILFIFLIFFISQLGLRIWMLSKHEKTRMS